MSNNILNAFIFIAESQLKMGITVDTFFCCVDLKLGTIIMAWWGMICKKFFIYFLKVSCLLIFKLVSGISIVLGILAAVFNKGNWSSHFPVHFNTGSGIVSLLVAVLLLCVYFYFSYQLLMGAQSVSKKNNFALISIYSNFILKN
jgi:hypothetical protein